MNLNAYIGLIERRWRQVRRDDGLHLEPADAWPARSRAEGPVLDVPASPWLLTQSARKSPRWIGRLGEPGVPARAIPSTRSWQSERRWPLASSGSPAPTETGRLPDFCWSSATGWCVTAPRSSTRCVIWF